LSALSFGVRLGAGELSPDADVRDEETQEGSHRQHAPARTRHEREENHVGMSQ